MLKREERGRVWAEERSIQSPGSGKARPAWETEGHRGLWGGSQRIRQEEDRATELGAFSFPTKLTSLDFEFEEKLLIGFKYEKDMIHVLRQSFWLSCLRPQTGSPDNGLL